MRIRRLLVACLLATPAVALPVPSQAVAPGAGVMTFTMTVDCWGCSESTGHLNGAFTGVHNGAAIISGAISAAFTITAGVGAGGGIPGVCMVNASGGGTFSGAINDAFTLTYAFPGTITFTNTLSGNVWVGYIANASINCLGQNVTTGAAGGVGASF